MSVNFKLITQTNTKIIRVNYKSRINYKTHTRTEILKHKFLWFCPKKYQSYGLWLMSDILNIFLLATDDSCIFVNISHEDVIFL